MSDSSNHVLRTLLETYIADLRARGLSERTAQTARRAIEGFARIAGVGLETPLTEVLEAHVERYRSELDARGYARWTKVGWIGLVKAAFRFACRRGMMLLDPTEAMAAPKADRKRRQPVLSRDEAARVLGAARSPRDRAILEVLYGSALRKGECTRLKVEDADLEAGLLHVTGKGGAERIVPLTRPAVEALRAYLGARAQGPLWLSRYGTPLGEQSVLIVAKKAGRRAGVALKVSPHMLRRSCATHLLAAGAGPEAVRRFLGHASLVTVHHYGVLQAADLREMIARYHPRP